MITVRDIEWATFLYNAMGEDILYMEDSVKVSEALKTGTPGKSIVDFLNHWRMRVPTTDIPNRIDRWYNSDGKELLNALHFKFLEADFDDTNTRENVSGLYDSLYRINFIKDTSASKILHIIRPDLFVIWDNEIRKHYLKEAKEQKETTGSKAYLFFLKKMQMEAISLTNKDNSIISRLSENLKTLYEGILANTSDDKNRASLSNAIELLGTKGRSITKFIDEYNWVKITKSALIPPKWHPQ